MKTKFCELHFRGRSTPHKIGEFYLSEHARRPQFAQNSILARSKAKIRNWKIISCIFKYMYQTLFTDKKWGKTLLAGRPLNRWLSDRSNTTKSLSTVGRHRSICSMQIGPYQGPWENYTGNGVKLAACRQGDESITVLTRQLHVVAVRWSVLLESTI